MHIERTVEVKGLRLIVTGYSTPTFFQATRVEVEGDKEREDLLSYLHPLLVRRINEATFDEVQSSTVEMA